jgi:salicylate hydroxylase
MRVQRAARRAGHTYHLGGALALARDVTIRALGAKGVMARQSWIFDWQV